MIAASLEFLKEQLNPFLQMNYTFSSPDRVAISNIVTQETGAPPSGSQTDLPDNKILISLIGVEEETALKQQRKYAKQTSGNVFFREPELKVNLFVLFAAHFDDYITGLKHLSGTIRFFQAYNVFDSASYPTLKSFNSELDKLIVDFHSLPLDQQYQFWQALGGKFLPSVLYKVRMLIYQENAEIITEQPIIELETDTNQLQG